MEYSANNRLWKFVDAITPEHWRSKQARRIYEAAVEQERAGDWIEHAVCGSVMLDVLPPDGSWQSPHGTDPDVAAMRVRDHIAALRRRATHEEQVLAAYGGSVYVTPLEPAHAPCHPFEAEPHILALISRPRLRGLWVHGAKFVRDASGAFVRAA